MKLVSKIVLTSVLIGAQLCLCSCQKAPEQSVVSKNDGAFESNITQTVAIEGGHEISLERNNIFSSTDGSVKYTWNIGETVQEHPMPVVEVVPHFFTGDDVKNISTALFQDAVFYEASLDAQQQWSKALLQEKIRLLSGYTSEDELKKYVNGWGAYSDLQDLIQRYTIQSETAPQEDLRAKTDWALKDKSFYGDESSAGDQMLHITTRVDGKDYSISATVRNQRDYQVNMLEISSGDGDSYIIRELQNALLCATERPSSEQVQEAKDKALKFLENIEEMGLGSFYIADTAIKQNEYAQTPQYSIVFRAVPVLENVPALWGHTGVLNDGSNVSGNLSDAYYAPVYPMTTVEICYNATGDLVSLYLDGLIEVREVKNSSVATLSFEELFARAENHLSLYDSNSWNVYQEGNSKLEVEINQMQYGLCRIAVSESEESYYYVPAVLFRGTIQTYRGDTGELINEETTTLVTINAIDGTII